MLAVRGLKKYFVIHHNPVARFRHPDHIIRAVDGVSFSVNNGEIFGIVGESGSGKTTLAKCMLRLYHPTDGGVSYRNRSVFAMSKEELRRFRRKVQPIFQDADSTLDPRQKVFAILEEPLLIHQLGDRGERKHRISEVIERVNLSSSLLTRHPSELSGGQRQRVAIARALLLEPEALIADEPTSGLDPMVAAQILDLLIALKKTGGVTIIFISHDLNTISYASDRIAVMYRGKIVEMIDGDYFQDHAQHPYTRFLRGLDTGISRTTLPESVHQLTRAKHEGCGYAHLCPYRIPLCDEVSPELRQIDDWLRVSCHIPVNRSSHG